MTQATLSAEDFSREKPPRRDHEEISLKRITASSYNPRRDFDDASLVTLAKSIQQNGVLSPILVRSLSDRDAYEIIAGERRFRAATMAGLETIPAIVQEVDDRTAREWALIENLEREDLNPIEEAEGYNALREMGYTLDQLSARIHRSIPAISNAMRLLRLPVSVRMSISDGDLSVSHGIALCGLLDTPDDLTRLADQAVEEDWTSKRLEQEVAAAKAAIERALNPPLLEEEPEATPQASSAASAVETFFADPPAVAAAAPLDTPREADTSPAAQSYLADDGEVREPDLPAQESAPAPTSAVAAPPVAAAPAAPSPAPITNRSVSPPAAPATKPATTAPAPQPAAVPAPEKPAIYMIGCTIPEVLDDWVYEQGLTVTTALETLRRFYDLAGRAGKSAEEFFVVVEEMVTYLENQEGESNG